MTASSPPPRLPATASIHWLIGAVRLIGARPGALLGVALALVCGVGALLMVASILVGFGLRDPGVDPSAPVDLSAARGVLLPLFALCLMAPQWVGGGLSAVFHALAEGRGVGVAPALAALRRRWLSLATLALLPALLFAAYLLLYRVLGGEAFLQQYMAAMQEAMRTGQVPPPPEAAHPGLLTLGLMLVNWVIYTLQLLAPVHVAVGGHGPLSAVWAALQTFIRQLPAMMVAGGLGAALMMAAAMLTLVLLVPAAAVSAVSPVAGQLITLAALALLAACFALGWSAVGYVAWRTTLGAGPAAPVVGDTAANGGSAAQGRIEV